MICNNCGEETNFVKVKITARWNDEMQTWEEESSRELVMCDTCNSFDVE